MKKTSTKRNRDRRNPDDMQAEYKFDYKQARPNRFAGQIDKEHFAIARAEQPVTDHLRILLWDIDGTLIRSTRTGAFKDYTVPMLEEVFGTAGRLPEMRVSGMTDLQIIGEALRDEGFTSDQILGRIDHLRESYMTAMRKATGNGGEFFEV